MRTQLFINNMEVDLGEDKNIILLNKQYENLLNPTDYFTEWSKTVKVPYSRQNNILFDKVFRHDQLVTTDGIDPRKRIPFHILYNGEKIFSGYCKVNLINYGIGEKNYEINLFGEFGKIMNDLKQLTFNANADVEEKYKVPSPFPKTVLDANKVRDSFYQYNHSNSDNTVSWKDYVGFMVTYQGKYPDFDSGTTAVTESRTEPLDDDNFEADEHYMHQFRSYYQQPFIYVDNLWKTVVRHFNANVGDGWKLKLSESWFNNTNPYYRKLIYTCPSLYDTSIDTNKVLGSQGLGSISYMGASTIYDWHCMDRADISNHHRQILKFQNCYGNYYCNPTTGLFNGGAMKSESGTLHINFDSVIFCGYPDADAGYIFTNYCKIRKDNAIYFKVYAAYADNMQEIPGSGKKFVCYSGDTNCATWDCDYKLNMGTCSGNTPPIVADFDCHGIGKGDGFFFPFHAAIDLNVVSGERPFYIMMDSWTSNNSTPFEHAYARWIPDWDWLWNDIWTTSDPAASMGDRRKGMTVFVPYYNSCTYEAKNSIRSNSLFDMYRVFPKDISIWDVLLNYCKMFGLYFDVDEANKEVTVMTRNQYFSDYEILDWTDKIDRSKSYQLKPISFENKYLRFNYEEGKGQRFDFYQSKYEASYGEKKINTGYDFNSESTDLFEGLVPSMISSKKQDSAWMNTRHPNGSNFLGYGYKEMTKNIFVENDDDGSSANMSGAFYFRNGTQLLSENLTIRRHVSNADAMAYVTDDSPMEVAQDTYFWSLFGTARPISYIPEVSTITRDRQYGIQFECPRETYYNRDTVGNTANTKYIYELFWKKYLDERYSVQNKVLTAYFYLNNEDFKNYKFNKFVKIGNVLYLPNKIYDFNVNEKTPTKVELVQVMDISNYTQSIDNFPWLSVDSEDINLVTNTAFSTFTVHSSSNWTATCSSSFFNFTESGTAGDSNLLVKARTANTGATNRRATITITNIDGLTETLSVVQEKTGSSFIDLNTNSLTFEALGNRTRTITGTWSGTLRCTSAPSWVESVTFDASRGGGTVAPGIEDIIAAPLQYAPEHTWETVQLRSGVDVTRRTLSSALPSCRRVTLYQTDSRFRRLTDYMQDTVRLYMEKTVTVKVKKNQSTSSRRGNIVLSNGVVNYTILVYQQGNSDVIGPGGWNRFDPIPIHIEDIDSGGQVVHIQSPVNIDRSTLHISTDYSNLGNEDIVDFHMKISATVPQPDYEYIADATVTRDGNNDDPNHDPYEYSEQSRDCWGGQIAMETDNGEMEYVNYNLGRTIQKYQVMFRSEDGISLTVIKTVTGEDPVTYNLDPQEAYFEEVEAGVQYAITMTIDDDYYFIEWSDGEQTQNRSITVSDTDIGLVALSGSAEQDLLQYDDGVNVAWDEDSTVSLHDD